MSEIEKFFRKLKEKGLMRRSSMRKRNNPLRYLRSRFFPGALAALLIAVGAALPARASLSPDALARLLAGNDAAVQPHAQKLSASWAEYERRIAAPLRNWAAVEVDAADGDTVFYPFSGPDFPTVKLLHPRASRYLMMANQPANMPPALDRLSDANLRQYLDAYARRWDFYAAVGFFRTHDLDADAARAGLRVGVTDLIMGFAARMGHEVLSVEPARLRADGAGLEPHPGPRSDAATWRSVRITLRQGNRTILVDYVCADLSDAALARDPAMRTFVQGAAGNRTVFKAASHLPQRPQFSVLRDAVLARAPAVWQDETGIDFALLEEAFDVSLYGRYSRAHRLFSGNLNRSLAQAYASRGDVRPLGFRVGYEKQLGSSVQLAQRRESGGAAELERRVAARIERYAARPRVVHLSRGLAETPEELAYIEAVMSRLPPSRGAAVVSLLVDREGIVKDASVDRGVDARLGESILRIGRLPAPPASVARRGDALVLTLGR